MGDMATVLRQRIAESRRKLALARDADDQFETDVYASQLADLLRRAKTYGIVIDGETNAGLEQETDAESR